MNNIGRRTFFSKISLSAIGTFLITLFPVNILAGKSKKLSHNIKIKLHPNSVSRNKKGC